MQDDEINSKGTLDYTVWCLFSDLYSLLYAEGFNAEGFLPASLTGVYQEDHVRLWHIKNCGPYSTVYRDMATLERKTHQDT